MAPEQHPHVDEHLDLHEGAHLLQVGPGFLSCDQPKGCLHHFPQLHLSQNRVRDLLPSFEPQVFVDNEQALLAKLVPPHNLLLGLRPLDFTLFLLSFLGVLVAL